MSACYTVINLVFFFQPLQCVQIQLVLGHRATLRTKSTPQGFTHNWEVFVRGPEKTNIQNFVDKVVFTLHKDFQKPKRSLFLLYVIHNFGFYETQFYFCNCSCERTKF